MNDVTMNDVGPLFPDDLPEAEDSQRVWHPAAHVQIIEIDIALPQAAGKNPQGARGGISAQQAASILEPIQSIPRTPEAAHLVVETWSHCDSKPTVEEMPLVKDGVADFPRDTDLAYSSASILAQAGFGAEAGALVDKGLVFVSRQSTRDYFEQLRATLGAPPSPPPK